MRFRSNKSSHGFLFFLVALNMLVCCSSPLSIKLKSLLRHNPDSIDIPYAKPLIFNKVFTNYNTSLRKLLDSLHLYSSNLHIEIDKSDYTLSVLSDTLLIKEYPVVFGSNPIDDKLREGDQCTPEGTFKAVVKYPYQRWSKFILISYPNDESLRKFNIAKRAGAIPSYSKPGGGIGIHGNDGYDDRIILRYNWTSGCISLKNKDINEIYNVVDTSTNIIIRK